MAIAAAGSAGYWIGRDRAPVRVGAAGAELRTRLGNEQDRARELGERLAAAQTALAKWPLAKRFRGPSSRRLDAGFEQPGRPAGSEPSSFAMTSSRVTRCGDWPIASTGKARPGRGSFAPTPSAFEIQTSFAPARLS